MNCLYLIWYTVVLPHPICRMPYRPVSWLWKNLNIWTMWFCGAALQTTRIHTLLLFVARLAVCELFVSDRYVQVAWSRHTVYDYMMVYVLGLLLVALLFLCELFSTCKTIPVWSSNNQVVSYFREALLSLCYYGAKFTILFRSLLKNVPEDIRYSRRQQSWKRGRRGSVWQRLQRRVNRPPLTPGRSGLRWMSCDLWQGDALSTVSHVLCFSPRLGYIQRSPTFVLKLRGSHTLDLTEASCQGKARGPGSVYT